MVKKKGKSKRQTFKQKYKIERRVKEHKRKTKKETSRRAKLGLPPLGIGQKKKANTIPNAWPFKEQLLEELAVAKRNAEEEKQRQKEEAALRKKQGLLGTDVTQLVNQAQARAQSFEAKAKADANSTAGAVNKDMKNLGQQSRRAFIRDLKEVVETADVILEVLDARDPLGSRAQAVEELILQKPNKKLVLVLNKVDLVPREIVAEWLAYLRRSHPALAFKSATQEQRSALSQHSGDASKVSQNVLSRSGSVGAEALMQLLKNYCRNLDIKTSISVGIIGYPNVGKSSLINSLKRCKSVGVSSTPGFTKAMQEVQLDKHIKLLDSPGIVFDDGDAEGVLLRNCVNVDTLPDPVQAVHAMLKRCNPQDLMMIYALPRFDAGDVMGFLALLAKKLGKLMKGGVPDRNAAARLLLRDWNTGKVPFYTKPPAGGAESMVLANEAQLVTGGLGEAFDVLKEGDTKMMDYLEQGEEPSATFVAFDSGVTGGKTGSSEVVAAMQEGVEEEDEMEVGEEKEEEEEGEEEGEEGEEEEEEEEEQWSPPLTRRGRKELAQQQERQEQEQQLGGGASSKKKGKKRARPNQTAMTEDDEEAAVNPKINQNAKKWAKEEKKKARKVQRRAAATSMEEHEGEDYKFATDFR